MFEVFPNLFIGTQNDCAYTLESNIIHACKAPCHQKAVGYSKALPQDNPKYLFYKYHNHLFLNLIDPEKPLFYIESFVRALDFIQEYQVEKILVHCNEGRSRSPSIVLLFLAKRLGTISNRNFYAAAEDFVKIYPMYCPRKGIEIFLENNWHNIS